MPPSEQLPWLARCVVQCVAPDAEVGETSSTLECLRQAEVEAEAARLRLATERAAWLKTTAEHDLALTQLQAQLQSALISAAAAREREAAAGTEQFEVSNHARAAAADLAMMAQLRQQLTEAAAREAAAKEAEVQHRQALEVATAQVEATKAQLAQQAQAQLEQQARDRQAPPPPAPSRAPTSDELGALVPKLVEVLSTLASEPANADRAVRESGGIPPLVALLGAQSASSAVRRRAVRLAAVEPPRP